jgi:transcriptional regulator of arginine metabolism
MNKVYRQGQILRLIQRREIFTQDDLAAELRQQGLAVSQVTISRDIQELELVKTPHGYKQIGPDRLGPDLATVVAEFLQDVRLAKNLVVLKTSSGNANALAVALDRAAWPEIVGTVAGDDTILVVTTDDAVAGHLRDRLMALITA